MQKLLSHWVGMPEFIQEKQEPFHIMSVFVGGDQEIRVRFENQKDYKSFSDKCGLIVLNSVLDAELLLEQKITEKTKSVWYPYKPHRREFQEIYVSSLVDEPKPRYPIYIVSKGRWSNGLTTKALHTMEIDHFIVVEESEFLLYTREANKNATIIILPQRYLDDYETCDDLGDTRSKGPGAARNFCIDHSKSNGFEKHWVMDDNLDAFHRLHLNDKVESECAATIVATEDFVDRYSNVPVAGLNYYSFCKTTDKVPPFTTNTRIYSCLLIENNSGYRWRGRYNEDTDLSLRVLKDGLCTIQMNAFLCGKVTTQRMSGGNTKEFYEKEGTLPKSKMLEDLHPDVAKVTWKFNRWHHHVDYSSFKKNKLILKDDKKVYESINDYGMIKIKRT